MVAINRLPIELLTIIICYCLPDEMEVYETMALCHVCSLWRNSLFGLTYIWKKLSFDFDESPPESTYDPRPALNFWVDHAKEQHLSLSLISKHDYLGTRPKILTVFSQIKRFASRIHELDIQVDSIEDIPFFKRKGGSLPALRKLCLVVEDRGHEEEWDLDQEQPAESPIMVFDAAPALRVVALGIHSERLSQQSYFACPWHQLTRLDVMEVIPPKTFYDIFIQCTNLTKASFITGTSKLNGTADVPLFKKHLFEHLIELKISIEGFNVTDEMIFHCFVFPNLQLFELRVERTEQPATFTCIFPGINASSLRCLELSGRQLRMNIDPVSQFLARCSALEILVLYLPEVPPRDIYRALSTTSLLSTVTTIALSFDFHASQSHEETLTSCEELVSLWCNDHHDRPKAIQLFTLVQGILDSRCGTHRLMNRQLGFKGTQRFIPELRSRLKRHLYDEHTQPRGVKLDVSFEGDNLHLPFDCYELDFRSRYDPDY
ncbi:hypothetical protein DXG01_014009 [Tephrocybe rancida]|nr:hypothetical protein DXG01_014009 [Tephrocybe rancida]